MEREVRERAKTKKLTRQTTKLVKKLLGSQNGKINCAHVFLFFLNCICSCSYVLLLLFLFCFLCFLLFFVICMFLPLLSIAVSCTLLFFFFTFQTLLQFAISDATRFCFCSDFMLFIFLLLLPPPFVFCHCVMHAARQQLLCIIILHILLGAFFIFWIFCIFHWPTKRDVATRSELNEPYTTIKIL